MSKVVLDRAAVAMLTSNGGQVEVCDETGNVIGYFRTAEEKKLYDEIEIPYTEEELRRAEEEPGGRSLAEILADLEKLT